METAIAGGAAAVNGVDEQPVEHFHGETAIARGASEVNGVDEQPMGTSREPAAPVRGTVEVSRVEDLHLDRCREVTCSPRPVETFHVETGDDNVSDVAVFEPQATLALKTLGYRKDVASRAIREALERDTPMDLESLLEAALRRCPR